MITSHSTPTTISENPANENNICRRNRQLAVISSLSIYLFNYPIGFGFFVGEVVVATIALGLTLSRKQIPAKSLYIVIPSVIICFGIWLGTLLNSTSWLGIYQPLHYIITLSSLSILFSFLDSKALLYFLTSSLWAIFLTALLAITIYVLYPQIGVNLGWIKAHRIALWIGVNRLGFVFAMAITLIFGFMFAKTDKKTFVKYILFLIIISISLMLTMSIGSFIAALIGTGASIASVLIARRFSIQKIIFFLIISILIIAMLPALYNYILNNDLLPERFYKRVIGVQLYIAQEGMKPDDEGSYSYRFDSFLSAAEMMTRRPLVGYGGGQHEYSNVYPHALPVLLYLEGGLIALFGISLFIFLGFIVLFRIWKDRRLRALAYIPTSTFFVFLVGVATHAHMYAINYHGILFASFFLLLKFRGWPTNNNKTDQLIS